MKRCQFFILAGPVTNRSCGLRECREDAAWARAWQGRVRHYCDDHKRFLDFIEPVADATWAKLKAVTP